jgi:hypothetical protein
MFDVEDGLGRHKYSFTRYLNSEPLTILYGIRKAAQLCHEICLGITFLNVSAAFGCHLNTTSVCYGRTTSVDPLQRLIT